MITPFLPAATFVRIIQTLKQITTMVRQSRGRQKIQMTRMSKESNLLVTFSKRRTGLFKKASELCTLCGAEIAIIVFSPGKKVFSFGHPGVEAIVDRYLEVGQAPPLPMAVQAGRAAAMQLVEAHRSASIQELNVQLNEMLGAVEAEKVRGEDLSRLRKEGHGEGRWWEAQIGEMSLGQLEQLREAMEDLRKKVFRQVEKMMAMMPPPPLPLPQFAAGVDGRGGDGGGVGVVEEKDVVGGGVGQLTVTPHGFTLGFGSTFF